MDVRDTVGSSRRAARSSSATSGRPPDRSTTTTRTLADGALALDGFDEAGQVVATKRPEGHPVRLARRAIERPQVDGPRVVAADGIRLVGPDDRHPLGAGDPGQEGDERSGPGVGAVQVLDDQQDRAPLPEPPDDAEDPLEQSRLAAFGNRGQDPVPVVARAQARPQFGQEAEQLLGRAAHDGGQVRVGERGEDRTHRPDQRRIRRIRRRTEGAAAEDGHGLLERVDPAESPRR